MVGGTAMKILRYLKVEKNLFCETASISQGWNLVQVFHQQLQGVGRTSARGVKYQGGETGAQGFT